MRLFLWEKPASGASKGTIVFVHGSSMASQPTFDLQVPGRPHSSVMEWFAERGFDTWTYDQGPSRFVHVLTFTDDVLTEIATGEYGTRR